MTWTEKDLEELKKKGYKIDDIKSDNEKVAPKKKVVKVSLEKNTIVAILDSLKRNGHIDDFVAEHRFHDVRRFRFDWAVVSLKIAIEYEGIFSKKSRHTTVSGYSKDIEKYNLALTHGWKVLRYTAKNYMNLKNDLDKLLNINKDKNETT